ncbi:L,D-transpeptidase family protein [Sphingobium sp. SYK-6]|uniref:L,D-transpeptidase family protein n=1 Tax=Sphingobium sp. (strain NBRC 103272 / SYK-6) TaxID=627192 RepID=UPI0002DAF187|nr:L,D-transpeptidase family protein [Sphingobium sp. SYK-6]
MRSFLLFGAGIVIAALGLHQQAKTRRVTPELSRISAESSGERTRQHYPPGKYPVMLMPDGERRAIHSILNVSGPMRFGTHVWNEAGVPEGPLWVRVDLARQILSVFRGGHEIGSAVILYGTDGKPTPTGSFTVLQKDADYHSRTYDAPMPYMLRLTDDGVAIHGSDVRVGRATHGCIGVPLAFARLLFAQMHKGDMVVIVPADDQNGSPPRQTQI